MPFLPQSPRGCPAHPGPAPTAWGRDMTSGQLAPASLFGSDCGAWRGSRLLQLTSEVHWGDSAGLPGLLAEFWHRVLL